MGQSSFGGGSLKSSSSRSSVARRLHCFFMRRPMLPLTLGVAISDLHARLTRLEVDGTLLLLSTFGTAVIYHLNLEYSISSLPTDSTPQPCLYVDS
jgi:hypothetical protein